MRTANSFRRKTMTISIDMETKILPVTEESVTLAKKILLDGGLVGIPTETVYGLGADGLNGEAVKKIFEVKGRPTDNPLIAHVHPDYDIEKLVYIDNTYALRLKEAFTPGPLTMVFRSKGVVCKEAVCGGDTLAVRIPRHPAAQQLLRAANIPVVAPSANVSKHVSPVTAMHVYEDLNGKIPLILDGGRCDGGIESTVLDVTESVPRILRAGLVTREMIAEIAGDCAVAQHKPTDKVRSPGVKYGHYMPRCETARFAADDCSGAVRLYDAASDGGKKVVILCESGAKDFFGKRDVIDLGADGETVASRLFAALRDGEKRADLIIAVEPRGRGGVYDGVMNRLGKAVKKFGEDGEVR